jgi:integrase
MKLTKRAIDSLTYTRKSGAQCVWDDDFAGFGVRVYPSGRKSFVVSYRADGKQRFFTLGRYGELTLHEAKTRAMEVLAAVRRGEDPSGDRLAYRQSPTMEDLAERHMREHVRPRKKPKGIENDARIWRKHVLPRLGKKKVADVTRADIYQLHAEMGVKTKGQANRTLATLSKAFNLCEVWGWRPDGSNPVRHVQRYPENKRERYLSQAELLRLAEALNEVERLQLEEPAPIAAIRLLLLTGCRSGEIKELRWSEVDFDRKCLRLADSKTGRKTIYLSSGALEILAGIERQPDNPYVIVGANPGCHLVGLTRAWYRIRKRAGLEDVRLHDLRHTYASIGAGLGLSLPMIGTLLGHTVPATTQRYAHLAAHPMLEAAERIGNSLDAAMSGRPKANVVEFRGRRSRR